MIEVASVTVRFGGVVALADVSARFSEPVSGIIGPNGAGKTTLMNVVSGFVDAEGQIRVDDTDILALAPHRRAHWGLRRSFQKEEIAEDLTVLDNVLVQLDSLPGGRAEKRERAMEALAHVGMAEHARRMGAELNSFERRLADIAKCMVGKPRLIMFDEPGGGLTIEETKRLGQLILSLHEVTGAQTLVIDHDVELISEVCSETLVLDFGRRIALGPTAEVLADPRVKAAYLGIEEVSP